MTLILDMYIDEAAEKLIKRSRLLEKKRKLEAGEDVDNISEISSKVYENEEEEEKNVERVRREFFGMELERVNKLRKEAQARRIREVSHEEELRNAKLKYLCSLPAASYKFPFYNDYDSQNLVLPEHFQLNMTGHSVSEF